MIPLSYDQHCGDVLFYSIYSPFLPLIQHLASPLDAANSLFGYVPPLVLKVGLRSIAIVIKKYAGRKLEESGDVKYRC